MVCYANTRAGKVNYVGECIYGPFEIAAEMYTAFASSILSIVYDTPTISSPDGSGVTNMVYRSRLHEFMKSPDRILPVDALHPPRWPRGKDRRGKCIAIFNGLFEGMSYDVQRRMVRS